jgi:DDE superfamily endonuclease
LCQVAVTPTYAVPAGHALIGRALYLPADRTADEERRELAGVPDEVMFSTKPELAGQLLKQAHDRGVRAAFTAGDEVYGGLDLRKRIRETRHRIRQGRPLELPGDPALPPPPHCERGISPGQARNVAADAHRLGDQGGQGLPLGHDRDHARQHPEGHHDAHAVLLLRKHRYTGTISYFLCWTPVPVPLATLIKVAVTRWKIEVGHRCCPSSWIGFSRLSSSSFFLRVSGFGLGQCP